MTTALVVEDDDRDMAAIEDTLCSMQHRSERCTNQADALKRVSEGVFDYAIIDLRIPARPDREQADIEFGGNLLRDIRQRLPESKLPIIVMADDVNCFGMARWLIDRGASEFISKPFQSTHELGDVIRRVMRRFKTPASVGLSLSMQPHERFAGGEIKIDENEAAILGIPIVSRGSTGHSLSILKLLAKRGVNGHYVSRSAEELATALGAMGGQTAVAGYVRTIRTNATERLKRSLGIDCGREDIIERIPSGYRLRDWITVEQASPDLCSHSNQIESKVGFAPELSPRQSWFIEQLSTGEQLDRRSIEKRFRVHQKTAKRDLTELSRIGLIEYVRDNRGGGVYRLCSPERQSA